MVDQVPAKEEASSGAHGGDPNEKKALPGNKAFKKKGSRNNNSDSKKSEGLPELLRGVGFTIARDGPDLYLKALKRLGLYVGATYNNGSELEMCLEAKELILPEEPVLPVNLKAHQQKMWDLCAAAVVKN